MKLSLRLQTIHDMVPMGIAADVGSDHGKLIISLFEDGIITKGYAIENKTGPYNRLVKALDSHHLLDDVVPLLSDGITDLPSCVDTVIIAGMGGMNVIKILQAHPLKLKNVQTIIVDAHNALPEMRKAICKLGYIIAEEKMVYEDNIYYEIIKFIKGEVAFLDEPDFEFGPKLRNEKSALFRQKYNSRIKEIDNLLSNSKLPQDRIVELNSEKQRIQKVL